MSAPLNRLPPAVPGTTKPENRRAGAVAKRQFRCGKVSPPRQAASAEELVEQFQLRGDHRRRVARLLPPNLLGQATPQGFAEFGEQFLFQPIRVQAAQIQFQPINPVQAVGRTQFVAAALYQCLRPAHDLAGLLLQLPCTLLAGNRQVLAPIEN